MAKRTFASVTQRLCKCESLERHSKQINAPIVFDERTNEYSIRWKTGNGYGKIIIYHCPFCGGATQKSQRDKLFALIPEDEVQRLNQLLIEINSIEDAIVKFGDPNHDFRNGSGVTIPEKDGSPPQSRFYRRIVYLGLSDSAEVHLTDYHRDRVDIMFQGKYLGS
jgi:hypothetical protein